MFCITFPPEQSIIKIYQTILQAFFDEQITRPKVSTSFATTNVKSGIALRFNLTQ